MSAAQRQGDALSAALSATVLAHRQKARPVEYEEVDADLSASDPRVEHPVSARGPAQEPPCLFGCVGSFQDAATYDEVESSNRRRQLWSYRRGSSRNLSAELGHESRLGRGVGKAE